MIIIFHHCYDFNLIKNFVFIIGIILYIPQIDDYFEILTDQEVKDFVVINFSEYFKSTKQKLYSKLNEEQNLRKVTKLLYLFLTTPDEVEKYVEIIRSTSSDNCIHHYNVEILNIFNLELQLINIKPIIKNKLKEFLSELRKFKIQTILVLDYKKRNERKFFHSCTKIIVCNSDINEHLHQNIMTKIKNYACEDWIVLIVIIKQSIKNFEC